MTTDDGIRASDGDREDVVAILRDAYVAGRLTLAEFDERTSAAFASRTWGDLRKLTGDLPPSRSLSGTAMASAGLQRQPGAPPPAAQPGRDLGPPGMTRLLPALPIVLMWVVIALSAHGAGAYLPLLILLIIGLKVAGTRSHGSRGRSSQARDRRPGHRS